MAFVRADEVAGLALRESVPVARHAYVFCGGEI
jgi:hypothetical protein